ncbi:MAG: hypothetical protein SFU86_19780 [Pirellulaceae bacterium]|nr:hypothetical protein [Pirellulaceae bacterium]
MKLLDQYRQACQVRRLTRKTTQVDCQWVEEHIRFHHDRTGRWWLDANLPLGFAA